VKSARGVKLNKASDGDETDDSVTTEQSSLSKIIFLLIQGLLAGFAFTTLYVQSGEGASDKELLNYYQPVAFETRRLFYILTSISTVGACDILMSMYWRQYNKSRPPAFFSTLPAAHLNPRQILASLSTVDSAGTKSIMLSY